MFNFKTLKDKRYWMFLPPFMIVLVSLYIFIGNNFKVFLIFGWIDIALFWTTFYIWKFFSDKKNRETNVPD